MKKYNKPVVEINGFQVEDIMLISTGFGGDQGYQAVYKQFVEENGGTADTSGQAVVFEW
jgi:hypothetical protein